MLPVFAMFFQNLTSVQWWLSVILVGVGLNVASEYLKRRLLRLKAWQSEYALEQRESFQKLVEGLMGSAVRRHAVERRLRWFQWVGTVVLLSGILLVALAAAQAPNSWLRTPLLVFAVLAVAGAGAIFNEVLRLDAALDAVDEKLIADEYEQRGGSSSFMEESVEPPAGSLRFD